MKKNYVQQAVIGRFGGENAGRPSTTRSEIYQLTKGQSGSQLMNEYKWGD